MKKAIIILSVFVSSLALNLIAQNIELTFTGDNNGQPVTLDSVIVKNLTQNGEVTLHPPELSLTLLITGIDNGHKVNDATFKLNQNSPNPFNNQTSIQLQLPGAALVKIMVSNLLGQELISSNHFLGAGTHTFSFTPGHERYYFLSASSNGQTGTIKMLCNPDKTGQSISLSYTGQTVPYPSYKTLQWLGELPFELGDELLMIAYSASEESGMVKSPEMSLEYIMQFATNIACPGLDSLLYESQWYHTIQVGGQCWLKENLNVGEMILSPQAQTNNGVIEKYCMGDMMYICDLVGGLYFWNEMMAYTNETGGQGICPEGWHVPTDMEWNILEGAADSLYSIGDPIWEGWNWRGFDAGGNLKQVGTQNWEYPNTGATDAFGFTALPGGYYVQNAYWGPGYKAVFYSSDPVHYSAHILWYNDQKIERHTGGGGLAGSVRCIKN